jgi:putative ABC transport system permease protein
VFQSYNLIPHQTVLSNVELALTLSGVSKAERRKRAIDALAAVGLSEHIHKKPNQMSGGQMQRVSIARALINDPDILLADEPTGALDSETSIQVMELLKNIAKDRLVIMVTHNPELAERYSTRTVRLLDGRIIDDTNPFEDDTKAPVLDKKEQKKSKKAKKKRSMSLGTALSLSLTNLLTKKGRTLLTSFAGSIGIIGIALILSLSNGIQNYINKVQEDTLSSYPITIEAETVDMSSMVSSLMGANTQNEDAEPHELDAVYSNTIMYDLMNNLTQTETRQNDLKSFKKYLEEKRADGELSEAISAVQYSYDTNMSIYTTDTDGAILKSDVTDLLQTVMSSIYGGDYSSYFDQFGAAYSRMDVWEEMLAPKDGDGLVNELISEQYDVIYGRMPQSYDEVVLIVDEHNEISDLVIYCMGLGSQKDTVELMQQMMNGETLDSVSDSWSYEDICSKTFKVVLPAEFYQYDSVTGTYSDLRDTDAGMDFMYNSEDIGTTVKIVGILRPNEDAVSTMMSGAIGYTSALTEYLLNKVENLDILSKQKDDPNTDVLNGLPFLTDDYFVSDEEKAADVTEYLSELSVTDKAAIYTALMSVPSEDYLNMVVSSQLEGISREDIESGFTDSYAQQMGVDAETIQNYISQMDDDTLFSYVEESIREQVTEQYAAGVQMSLGAQSADQLAAALDMALSGSEYVEPLTSEQYNWLYDNYMPATVSISTYEDNLKLLGDVSLDTPSSISIYASTFADKDVISDAIEKYNDGLDESEQIEYTDYVALLMSSVTTIINAISYVLIAFVAISLVVSSIMIGIITYISVLERTKEIGILRAIGASKKDVSRVFNAETLIIGFCAGAIGIGITLLLIIPINALIRHLSGIQTLGAQLPVVGGVALVIISMLLTFIAGLVPSGIAAKKNPVEALRTE